MCAININLVALFDGSWVYNSTALALAAPGRRLPATTATTETLSNKAIAKKSVSATRG